MRIVYIHRADFDKRPPVISAVFNLLKLDFEVVLVTGGITRELKLNIESLGGKVKIIPYKLHENKIQLLIRTLKYRFALKQFLNNFDSKNNLLWVEGNYTFSALAGLIDKFNYILQIQELHKNRIEYWVIKRLISKAKLVFMPEYNRAFIYKSIFKLKKVPIVLPNKPDFIPSDSEISRLKIKYHEIVSKISGKKIILYQGIICKERDLRPFIKAFDKLDDNYLFILLGKDYGEIDSYRKISDKILHIPYLSAPDYLLITSMSYIGVVTYVSDSLNTVYCAPNKIFEYAAYSLPIIANDIPGLRYPINQSNIGIIVDEKNEKNILAALNDIVNNYKTYSTNAKIFFNSINNQETIKAAIKEFL